MKSHTKPIITFTLGLILVLISPATSWQLYLVFIGMVLVALGIIDLAWITIETPKVKRHVSKEERKENLRRIKKAVTKHK